MNMYAGIRRHGINNKDTTWNWIEGTLVLKRPPIEVGSEEKVVGIPTLYCLAAIRI